MKFFSKKTNAVSNNKTNSKKKKSKINKLIPPVAMISASMLLMAYSSYAWFSMNTKTTADGMKVRVKAEGGLAISLANNTSYSWKDSVTVNNTEVDLYPTSTADASNWYHHMSPNTNTPDKNKSCTDITSSIKYQNTTSAINSGVGYIDADGTDGYSSNDESYFLLNNFKLKSNRAAISSALNITNVSALSTTGEMNEIDKSLRVAVVVYDPADKTSSTFIFAPCHDSAPTYKVNTTDFTCSDHKITNKVGNISSIPFEDEKAFDVRIYCYYEGEDDQCYTDQISNLSTINTMSVSVEFGIDPANS